MWHRAPILIVSGDPQPQDAYVRVLRRLRTPAVGVDEVEDALRLIQHLWVQAALFDVLTPADWESCRRLCESLPSTSPVIVLSGRVSGDGEYRQLARRIGCSGFIAKPCAPEIVVNALNRVATGERWTEHVEAG